MISLDTETTGVDLKHGAKPFFVTICEENGDQLYWEWDVDPLTREPNIPKGDLFEISVRVDAEEVVLQNAKFDVKALETVWHRKTPWDWSRTYDTLLAGHLLASNQPHDLTSMALVYLGVDIAPYEERLKEACTEARKLVKKTFPDWKLAEEGLATMPSVKGGSQRDEEKPWKNDSWLPRTLALKQGYPPDHPWYTVLREYANADSAVTLALWKKMKIEIERRKLWNIYRERLKVLPVVHSIENCGLTGSRARKNRLEVSYREDQESCARKCVNLASSYGFDLKLPKGAVNNSLRQFCFEVMKLEPIPNPKAKTTNPSLDSKVAIPHYLATLEPHSKPLSFIQNLVRWRGKGTALGFLASYDKFMLPTNDPDTFRIYPALNPTGTDTLRFASYNPNGQQVSKKEETNLREAFGPGPDREWWSIDAKNIELRLPAYECGEKDLIDLFEREKDPPYYGSEHILNFSIVYEDLWAAAVKEVGLDKAGPYCKKKYAASWYQRCKNGDFAVGYGAVNRADGKGTADRAFGRPGSHAKLLARFEKKEALNQKWIRFAKQYGYVETIPDRTVDPERGYPLLCTRSEWGDILPTVPLNYHIQGSAMWWTMKAMIRCAPILEEWTRKDPRGYYITLQVHDEMVFDFPRGRGLRPWMTNLGRIKEIAKTMELGGADFGIPTPVGIEYHANNWGEGMTL